MTKIFMAPATSTLDTLGPLPLPTRKRTKKRTMAAAALSVPHTQHPRVYIATFLVQRKRRIPSRVIEKRPLKKEKTSTTNASLIVSTLPLSRTDVAIER
jgi:hypothetical protein